jgi:hypothetical protein
LPAVVSRPSAPAHGSPCCLPVLACFAPQWPTLKSAVACFQIPPLSAAPASALGTSEQNVRLAAPCDRASRYHHREGAPLWKPNMRKLITTIALLALVDTSVAIAQTAGNPAAHRSTNSGQQLLPGDAPVGHRQPRADQVPSEKNPMDDSINRENAALDRMTKGICRGC